MSPKRRRNPFLETVSAIALVCLDCGLDFDVPFDEPDDVRSPW